MARTSIYDDVSRWVNTNQRYDAATLAACKKLARSKPWQGDFDKRRADFGACFESIRAAYPTLEGWTLAHDGARTGCSGGSELDPSGKRIVLRGRPSVVTLLHLIAKVRFLADADRHARAIRWSVTLFKRVFPISFGRCRMVGGLLVNDGRRDD